MEISAARVCPRTQAFEPVHACTHTHTHTRKDTHTRARARALSPSLPPSLSTSHSLYLPPSL